MRRSLVPVIALPLIAAAADEAVLLGDNSAVLYQKDGALYAAPLQRLDKAAYLAARREADKQETMTRAKQIGLGMMMYVMDYDERFPAAPDVANTVSPYLKNTSVFEDPTSGSSGFTFLLNGDLLGEIATPANTPLGYLSGPGGRAVVYADGHVKWENLP